MGCIAASRMAGSASTAAAGQGVALAPGYSSAAFYPESGQQVNFQRQRTVVSCQTL